MLDIGRPLSSTEEVDLDFLWRHAWAYADTCPSLSGDECDAYATWYHAKYGESWLHGYAPEHLDTFHVWWMGRAS